jgi:hypothetical protein
VFVRDLHEQKFSLGMGDDELIIQMKNSLGVQSALFVPERCFYQLSMNQIERLRGPSLKCLNHAHRECLTLVWECITIIYILNRFIHHWLLQIKKD